MDDNKFPGIIQTSMPEKEHQLYASLNWNPFTTFSMNSSIRYTSARNTEYSDIEEDLYGFVISAWYMPFERMTLMGSFTLFDNKIDSDSVYNTHDLPDLIFYDNVPYKNTSHSIYLSSTYQLNPRLALTGEVTFTDSDADFDTIMDSRNIGAYSDLKTNQVQTSVGFSYLVNPRMSLYGKYAYHKYNDREDNTFDGEYSRVSFGLNYSF
jgi:predicted porin